MGGEEGARSGSRSTRWDVVLNLSDVQNTDVTFNAYLNQIDAILDADPDRTLTAVVDSDDLRADLAKVRVVDGRTDGSVAFDSAVRRAASLGRRLLILTGLIVPTVEGLKHLDASLDLDPFFGAAQPRFRDATTGEICALPADQGHPAVTQSLSSTSLRHLPSVAVVSNLTAVSMLLRCDLLRAIEAPSPAGTFVDALSNRLLQARQLGFQTVVVNTIASTLAAGDGHADAQIAYLSSQPTDVAPVSKPLATLEKLVAAAYPPSGSVRRLLVDGRGVFAHHDGASQYFLGFLDGLAKVDRRDFQIEIHSDESAAKFHEFERRFPLWRHFHDGIVGPYAAVVVPTTPTALSNLNSLHRSSLVILPLIRDTVASDIAPADGGPVAQTWAVLARFVNGLSFVSEFTRARFARRFGTSDDVLNQVIHPSLSAHDYLVASCQGLERSDFVLVFGNEYAHKGVGPTIRMLLDAFPFQHFVVFGSESAPHPRVEWIRSGSLPTEAVHRLFATAQAVVYPSFLEGFGFPAIEAMSYGADVFVRSSALWPELIRSSRLPGSLYAFDSSVSLVESLGRVFTGQSANTKLEEPAAIDAGEVSWRSHASGVLALVERCLEMDTAAKWAARNLVAGFAW